MVIFYKKSAPKSNKTRRFIKKNNFFLIIFCLFLIASIVLSPKTYITATLDGLSAWVFNVLPALLPFMVVSKILAAHINFDKLSRFCPRAFSKLFGVPESALYPFCMGLLSGYPMGAKLTDELCLQGRLTQNEAVQTLSFACNSGPMFIIGVVGTSFLGNVWAGYAIYVAHILGALANGIFWRILSKRKKILPKQKLLPSFAQENPTRSTNFTQNATKYDQENTATRPHSTQHDQSDNSRPHSTQNDHKSSFGEIIEDTCQSLLLVGGVIAFFFVVLTALSPLTSLLPKPLAFFVEGLVEVTRGCKFLSTLPHFSALLCCFVISFGGLSTILQSKAVLKNVKISTGTLCLQKLTHAIFSTLILAVILLIF